MDKNLKIYEIKNVVKSYSLGSQRLSILKGLNLEVPKGVALCITGLPGPEKAPC